MASASGGRWPAVLLRRLGQEALRLFEVSTTARLPVGPNLRAHKVGSRAVVLKLEHA